MTKEVTAQEPVNDKQLTGYLDAMGLAQALTQKEKVQFLEISKAFGLNPFKREIYVSKYGDQMSIIVGYETYIKRAERSGQLDGWQVVTEGRVEDNTLKATITIHRKDRKYPFVHEVFYSEYVQKTKDGRINKFWLKAFTMTKKVAMAQGFRLCFSDELGGMPYTKEEMPDITEDITHEEVKEAAIPEFFMTLDEKVDAAISQLNECGNLMGVAEMWGTLSLEVRKDARVLECKENLKTKFTPATI